MSFALRANIEINIISFTAHDSTICIENFGEILNLIIFYSFPVKRDVCVFRHDCLITRDCLEIDACARHFSIQISSNYRVLQKDASLRVHGGLSVGPYLSIHSSGVSERDSHFSSFRSLLVLSLFLPRLFFIFYGRSGKTGGRRASKKEERDIHRAGKTRLLESRLSLLRGSVRYLSRHLHIKLTHNVRHISGNHWRVFVPAMRRQRDRAWRINRSSKGGKYYGKDRASSTESAAFFFFFLLPCRAGSFFNGQLVSNMH